MREPNEAPVPRPSARTSANPAPVHSSPAAWLLSASARAQPLLGPVVAGGPERGANSLTSGDALDRQPDVDRQADAVADRHVQGLEAPS